MIIDAKDLLLGRMGSYVAKQAMLGHKVDIINCSEAVISGSKQTIIAEYKQMYARGIPAKGPFHHAVPSKLVRRSIRGMLPYKKDRGREAYKNIHCHNGAPSTIQDQKVETLAKAHMGKLPYLKFMRVKDLCVQLGARQ